MCESWRMGSIVWKALAASSAVVATLVATKVADQIWKTTGQDDIDPADPESMKAAPVPEEIKARFEAPL